MAVPAQPNDGDGAFLRAEGIEKTFGRQTALAGVSVGVTQGEFVCILGPSGCGKTTLLRVIAGLEAPEAGRVWLRGRDISRLPPARRECGIVFQSYALFPNMTATANVAYGLRGLRGAARRARALEMLELVGLADHARKHPAQLSGGQQQRVALARALAPEPAILLLDEPLSALDARVRARLRREIRALQRRLGITTVMVTHDQEEALTMADRIVVMNHARIVQSDSPQGVYHRPVDPFVGDFVGSMNLLPGWRVAEDGRLVRGEARLALPAREKAAPGAQRTLGVRPEDVRIGEAGLAGINRLDATIAAMEFRGAAYRLTLELVLGEGGAPARLEADIHGELIEPRRLQPGARISVELPPERLLIYDAAATA